MWTPDGAGIETIHAQSAMEFIALLRRSHPCWWEGDGMPWAFRGHSDSSWSLLPSAWRGHCVIEAAKQEAVTRLDRLGLKPELKWVFQPGNFFSGVLSFGSADSDLAKQLVISANSEILPIYDFLNRCNQLGLNQPFAAPIDPDVNVDWLHMPGLPLIADEVFYYSDIPLGLAFSQHHGLPTRLLDWTLNPSAAAFFAVENVTAPQGTHNIAVWAIHRFNAAKAQMPAIDCPQSNGGKITPAVIVFRPTIRDNPYLAAQSGLFTCVGGSGIYFMQHDGKRPALDDFVRDTGVSVPVLRKITLSRVHVAEVQELLRREGVSRSAFMPTADNAAADVMRRWERRLERLD